MKKSILLLAAFFLFACSKKNDVRIWEETIVIPTYEMGTPEPNPYFYVPSNYQGAQNRVYPYPFLDKIGDKKIDKAYKGLFLENNYIKICVLPELGGRLYYAVDKTNGYDFIYRNNVIKPALIGMAGAWCSGGVEWNLPHHHRVSCHMPVNYKLVENSDGSKTIWVGEYEKRHGMKWDVGMTLRPGKSYVETDIKLINVTPVINSFLCFANMAVSVNETYQVIFPPDVEKAVFHAKVQFADWPVLRQEYMGIDFTKGVDVSWWKNTPSPTSFFAYGTKMDFLAGIDHGKKSGTVLIGDHNICVGKKMWNWGNNEVQRLWDQMLTDKDGPYLELMMGAYSDNQPDYSWNDPQSAREVKMYYYPCRNLESIKNANQDFALNIDVKEGKAVVEVNATSDEDVTLIVEANNKNIVKEMIDVDPAKPFTASYQLPQGTKEEDVKITLVNDDGKELLAYQKPVPKHEPNPPTFKDPADPKDIATVDELYLRGLRLEEFHNSHLDALPYYLEALKREPDNVDVNTQLGIYYIKRYRFDEAIVHLRNACQMVTMNHTRPKNSEPLYYLGVALLQNGKTEAAYDTLARAAWNNSFSSAAYYLMAQIDCQKNNFEKAFFHLDYSIKANNVNIDALNLKALLLRKTGKKDEAVKAAREAIVGDALDIIAMNELALLGDSKMKSLMLDVMRDEPNNYLASAERYAHSGFYQDAIDLLKIAANSDKKKLNEFSTIYYHLGYYSDKNNDKKSAEEFFKKASSLSIEYCFPFGMESAAAMNTALIFNPKDDKALYYLGNIYADFIPKKAVEEWKKAIEINPGVAVYHRNLAYIVANVFDQIDESLTHIYKAIEINPNDPLYLVEADDYEAYKGTPAEKRLSLFEKNIETVNKADATVIRMMVLQMATGRYDAALKTMNERHFHAFEKFDGNIHVQWVDAHVMTGKKLLEEKQYDAAIKEFEACLEFPRNLEIARDSKAQWGYYWLAQAYQLKGDKQKADEYFTKMTEPYQVGGWAGGEWPEALYSKALACKELGDAKKSAEVIKVMTDKGNNLVNEKKHDASSMYSVGKRHGMILSTAKGYYFLALAELAKNNRAKANEYFDKAMKLNPEITTVSLYR
jgi:tetratricopeptide (TPR) repeat protein